MRNAVDDLGADIQRAGAHGAHEFLGSVAQVHHGLDFEKPGTAFHGVEDAEQRVELFGVGVGLFKGDDLFAEGVDHVARLGQKISQQFLIHGSASDDITVRRQSRERDGNSRLQS